MSLGVREVFEYAEQDFETLLREGDPSRVVTAVPGYTLVERHVPVLPAPDPRELVRLEAETESVRGDRTPLSYSTLEVLQEVAREYRVTRLDLGLLRDHELVYAPNDQAYATLQVTVANGRVLHGKLFEREEVPFRHRRHVEIEATADVMDVDVDGAPDNLMAGGISLPASLPYIKEQAALGLHLSVASKGERPPYQALLVESACPLLFDREGTVEGLSQHVLTLHGLASKDMGRLTQALALSDV